jgi:flagellar basal-body rod protein FlgB
LLKLVVEVFEKKIEFLRRALDYRQMRHNIIVANIANVDTPQYRAKDLYFLHVLEDMVAPKKRYLELTKTNPKHMGRIEPKPPEPSVYYTLSSFGNDKNGVDIDLEMAKLSSNQINYRAIARFVAGKFEKLKRAIGGPGGGI